MQPRLQLNLSVDKYQTAIKGLNQKQAQKTTNQIKQLRQPRNSNGTTTKALTEKVESRRRKVDLEETAQKSFDS